MKLILILTVSFSLLAAVIANSANRLSHSPRGSIRVDNQVFDGVFSDYGNASLLEFARRHVRSGAPISKRYSGSIRDNSNLYPNRLHVEHAIAFGNESSTKEISTGKLAFPALKARIPFPEEWEYHPVDKSGRSALAIRHQKGINTIVLIDRNRGTFLSITQTGP